VEPKNSRFQAAEDWISGHIFAKIYLKQKIFLRKGDLQ
jgi:hypothetical protein